MQWIQIAEAKLIHEDAKSGVANPHTKHLRLRVIDKECDGAGTNEGSAILKNSAFLQKKGTGAQLQVAVFCNSVDITSIYLLSLLLLSITE